MAVPFKKTTLKNKAKIVLIPMHETKAVTLLVFVPVGSRYEPSELAGASHFLEHVMFKGTEKRPDTTKISRELDAIGAEYNAFTGKDHTGYYIKVASEHMLLACDMLSDMLTNSLLDATEMEREKGVIIEEIHMYEDNPMMHVDDLIEETLFPSSTLGRNIAGTEQSMKEMQREKVLAYYHEWYRPQNMTIVLAGNLPKNVTQILQKTFGVIKEPKLKKLKTFTRAKPLVAKDVATRVKVQFKETEQVHVAIGFPGYGYGDPRLAAQGILANVLGGNMSSRLFIEVRERRGLCYYIRASLSPYQDLGAFTIQSGLTKARMEEGVKEIIAQLKLIRENGITDEELARAKEYTRGKLILNLEETSEVADWYGRQQLFMGTMLTPEQKLKKIMAVKKEDVLKVARDILREDRLCMAVVGPYKDAKQFQKLATLGK